MCVCIIGIILFLMTIWRFEALIGDELSYPFGPDTSIWGKAALLARYNAPQTVPPAFPELVSLMAPGGELVQGALRTNIFSSALGVLGCYLGGLWMVSSRVSSLLVGVSCAILALYTFPFFPYMYYIQPDIMALAMVSMCGAGLLCVYRFQNTYSVLFLGFWIGMAFSTREHGLVLLASCFVFLWWLLRNRSQIWIFLLGVQFGGGLGAGAPYLPFFRPHGGLNGSLTKAQVALMDTLNQRTENNVVGKTQYEQGAEESTGMIDFLTNVIGQSIEKSSDFHMALIILLLGAIILCMRKKGWVVVLIALSPLFASLVVWTQWRHFFVLLPIMTMIGWGGLGILIYRLFRVWGIVALLGYAIFYSISLSPYQVYYAKETKQGLLKQQKRYTSDLKLAKELTLLDDGQSLLMADPTMSILTGMAPIFLQGEEIHDPGYPAYPNFVYWTLIVTKKKMGRRWELLKKSGTYFVYQSRRPSGVDVRCLKGEWDGPIVERLPPDGVRLRPRASLGCSQYE
ncbi:MAG: hypothetical protein CL916_11695 [Deltaproteobacteria bacterium]|nr:hypothetical protein [Deltaproteobacteria bacterium]